MLKLEENFYNFTFLTPYAAMSNQSDQPPNVPFSSYLSNDSHQTDQTECWAFDMIIFITGFLLQFFCLFAILGNILNCIVLARDKLADTTTILFFCLSVSDLVFSLTTFLSSFSNIFIFSDIHVSLTIYSIYGCYLLTLNGAANASSFVLICIVSVERVIAVWLPLHVSTIITTFRIKCVLVTFYFYLLLITMPNHFSYICTWYYSPVVHKHFMAYKKTNFKRDNQRILDIFYLYVRNNLLSTVPLVIVMVSTTMILGKLFLTPKTSMIMKMNRSKTKKIRENRVITMILIVCTAYISIVLPTCVLDMYIASVPAYSELDKFLTTIQILFFQIHASINFIVYFLMSTKYVKYYKMLCRQRKIKS